MVKRASPDSPTEDVQYQPRTLAGRAKRYCFYGFQDETGQYTSEFHQHADHIHNCVHQALLFIESFLEANRHRDYEDLESATFYLQTAQDVVLDGLLKTLDDAIIRHIQQAAADDVD